MTAPLTDAVARQVVIGDLDRTLFVEAGAGSGKTRSLVERVANLVVAGVPVTQIAAITFTEAAARELRIRVRDELERRAVDTDLSHLVDAAAQVEGASFTTLHGFALQLLSDHPVEAGLPPGFGVIDEISSILDFQEGWRSFAGRIGDDMGLLDLQERAAILGVELRRFVEVARRFDDNWDLLDRIELDPRPLEPLATDELIERLAGLRGLTNHCNDTTDTLVIAIGHLVDQVEAARSLDPLERLALLRRGLTWPNRRRGRKANWTSITVDDARRSVDEVRSEVDAALAAHTGQVIDHMVAHVARFVQERLAVRRADGELAFHDLLVLARRLLRDHPDVRGRLRQRYRRILLDEFQDTDPIQIELAVLLSTGGEVGDRRWQDLVGELEAGRLVVVGDPKQSIYRFRRADIGVYGQAEAALASDVVQLSTNFRSVPGVVDWVNEVFSRAIGDGETGAQPSYTALAPHRRSDPRRDGPPVVVIGGPHDRSVPVGAIREIEAADVAAVVCRAVEEEWRVERDGQWRPVRLQDIAVLVPSRLSLPALEAAFSATDVPFRPETNSLVYATQEVRDVLAAVRATVDPGNDIDVVAALRSSLFAVGDDDLLSWHQAGRSWDYRRPAPDSAADLVVALDGPEPVPDGPPPVSPDHPVARAFETLAAWHHDRWWTTPSALIDRIVRERRLRELALAETRPRDRWRRYRFLAEQAREFEATRGGDLTDFVAWAEVQASDLARVIEPIPAEPDDDAVRVLTIHGSKGLEFPMVILAGAPTEERRRAGGPRVLFPTGGRPQVKVGKGVATGEFDFHASVEEVLDGHERIRLHYVAATRARDLLVVSAHHKSGRVCMGHRTWTGCEAAPGTWLAFERRGDERYQAVAPTKLRRGADDHREEIGHWLQQQAEITQGVDRRAVVSATGLAERLRSRSGAAGPAPPAGPRELAGPDRPARLVEGVEPDPERQPWRRGRAGTKIGSAVHAVLQQVPFEPSGAGLDQLARMAAEQEGVAGSTATVADLARTALSAPAVELARHHRHWRELYVAHLFGSALVEGFVDLCVELPDGLVVVDYKTDPVTTTAEADAKVVDYRIQGAVYALALEQVTGQPVIDCRFVFVGPDGVVERSLPDLDLVRSEARAGLEIPSPDDPPESRKTVG
jgi:ATP-dependent exoDNAse (exonuclease V) beta subunit